MPIPQQALFEQFVASLDHARTVSPFFKAQRPEFGNDSSTTKKDFFLDVNKQAHQLREQLSGLNKLAIKQLQFVDLS